MPLTVIISLSFNNPGPSCLLQSSSTLKDVYIFVNWCVYCSLDIHIVNFDHQMDVVKLLPIFECCFVLKRERKSFRMECGSHNWSTENFCRGPKMSVSHILCKRCAEGYKRCAKLVSGCCGQKKMVRCLNIWIQSS